MKFFKSLQKIDFLIRIVLDNSPVICLGLSHPLACALSSVQVKCTTTITFFMSDPWQLWNQHIILFTTDLRVIVRLRQK